MPPTRILMIAVALLTGCAVAGYKPGLRRPVAPLPQIAHHEGRFESWGGVSLFEQSWRPLCAEFDACKPRAVVVIVHGLKDHSDRYADLAGALVAKGFAVHALDLRGHGDSAGDRVWCDFFDDYTADVQLFVRRVARAERGRPIYLFGHSMGGAIAALVAMRMQPPQLAGLILSAPAIRPPGDVGPATIGATHFFGSLFPALAVLDLPDEKFSRDPRAVAALKADPLVYHGNGPARTASELLTAMDRIDQRMDRLFLPLLVLHGTADQLTNPRGSEELVKRASAADKTLKLYKGLAHDLWHEPERGQVTADLVAWLDQRAPVE